MNEDKLYKVVLLFKMSDVEAKVSCLIKAKDLEQAMYKARETFDFEPKLEVVLAKEAGAGESL